MRSFSRQSFRDRRAILLWLKRNPRLDLAPDFVEMRRRLRESPASLTLYSHAALEMLEAQAKRSEGLDADGIAGDLVEMALDAERRKVTRFRPHLGPGEWRAARTTLPGLAKQIPDFWKLPRHTDV